MRSSPKCIHNGIFYSWPSPSRCGAVSSLGPAIFPLSAPYLRTPLTTSSTRNKRHALSTAVLMLCVFTICGSQTPYSFISTILPKSPSMPHVCSLATCFAYTSESRQWKVEHTRRSVRTLTAFPPQFWTRVRGMTSIASATDLYGQAMTPGIVLAFSARRTAIAISVAPPPGHRRGWKYMFLVTLHLEDFVQFR